MNITICTFEEIHCYVMYSNIFEISFLKINELYSADFVSAPGLALQAVLKKTKTRTIA